ncbi:MAG: hypothetical protein AAF657_11465 [Acidobacteriota bacterium]
MRAKRSTLQTLLLLTSVTVLQSLTWQVEAQGHRGRAISHRSPQAQQHQARATSHRPPLRRAPSGFGSAANVRPGFYQRLSAPVQRAPIPHAPVHTVPIYVYLDPPVYHQPPPVDPRSIPAPAPAPQPIYVVAPPAPAPAQPVAAPVPTPVTRPPAPTPAEAPVRSTEPGEVLFSIRPATSKVYLDDDYLGTAAEIAALGPGQMFPPGVHVLEVTHPDFRPQRLVFGVSSEEPTHVLIDLSIDRVGRRSRIK